MNDESSREVYIKNLPYAITQHDLYKWCSTFGPITKCALLRDRFGNSRGFAFVTYSTNEGYSRILSEGPHYCQGRPLVVRAANGRINPTEDQSNTLSDQMISANENIYSTAMDPSLTYDDDDDQQDRLASLRDEFDANMECMKISHDRELKLLQERLAREKKLRDDAKISYEEAGEDCRNVREENVRLRTNLIKNVMQTFNIRREYARRVKEELDKCAQIEANRITSNNS